jgi:hypothetical protein
VNVPYQVSLICVKRVCKKNLRQEKFLTLEAVSKPFITVVERGSVAADVETTVIRSCRYFGASTNSATETF